MHTFTEIEISYTSKNEISNPFLFLWVIFSLLDPDPDLDCESGYGSRDPNEFGSNPDPDKDPDPQRY
jgi:hypothetical protein